MAEQTVTLEPGESKLVSFEAVPNEAKTYQVSVDGLTGSFRAVAAPPVTAFLRPNGAGFQTQLTPVGDSPNWKCVDEEIPDEMATHVRNPLGTLSADRVADLYTLSDFPETRPVIINWVKIWLRCYIEVGGYPGSYFAIGGVHLRTHGTVYPRSGENADPYVLWQDQAVAGWFNVSKQLVTNPYTGLAWTVAELNDLQAGVWLWGKNIYRYCTQVYVEVNYLLA